MDESSEIGSPSAVEHPLHDKWVLWAHLPHDTDWSLKSYIKIIELDNMEVVFHLKYQIKKSLMFGKIYRMF